ncbi:MAG: hypothetical protein AAFW64_01690 [Pseudomonadota bacterium]
MSDRPSPDDPLETFFEAARATAPTPGADLTARVLADAAAAQPAPPVSVRRAKPSWFGALGGWPALAGLVTATVAGVSIGVADPAYVGDLAFSGFGDAYDFSTIGTALDLGLEGGLSDG